MNELAAVKLRARNKFLKTCYRQRCQITSENTKCEQFIMITCGNQVKSKKQIFVDLLPTKMSDHFWNTKCQQFILFYLKMFFTTIEQHCTLLIWRLTLTRRVWQNVKYRVAELTEICSKFFLINSTINAFGLSKKGLV